MEEMDERLFVLGIFAVLVNGNAKGWVKASRGLRQGDPLSSFLFTLVADILNDTIFFSNTSEEDLQTLRVGRIARLQGFWMTYSLLGSPFGRESKACGFWDPVIERILKRLDGYLLQWLQRLRDCKGIFLWSGVGEGKRDHLVSWEVVCKPKAIGGLGFGKIVLRNVALLGKWLWRYPREGSTLWHKVISSIYGSHSNGWDANTIVRWSHCCPWKTITQVFQEFSKFTRFVVGNGDKIRFWEDLWWGDQSLGSQYPRLFRVVTDKNILISSILGSTRPFSWNFNFRRNLFDLEIEDLEVFPTKFVWNSQVPFKVKSFVWLVAHKKVNTNDLLQLRRPHKALVRILLAKMDWVPPRSISDMLSITYSGFGLSRRGIVLWQAACIALIWVVRYNYSAEERKGLVELVSYIKSIGSMMQRCDTLVADALWETIHAEVQDFVQNTLATMLRTTFRKKRTFLGGHLL
ncbi:Protein PIR [Vitis vinifera]|uniref:Protein PIR n=1 Tax=Vitis vinifera TaxID=29760 RepID=A0A438EJ57_VITVI|nr:Protein PIR [Vitis vinifera]